MLARFDRLNGVKVPSGSIAHMLCGWFVVRQPKVQLRLDLLPEMGHAD